MNKTLADANAKSVNCNNYAFYIFLQITKFIKLDKFKYTPVLAVRYEEFSFSKLKFVQEVIKEGGFRNKKRKLGAVEKIGTYTD